MATAIRMANRLRSPTGNSPVGKGRRPSELIAYPRCPPGVVSAVERGPVYPRHPRLSVQAQPHHDVHVHRADAERREPVLCQLRAPVARGEGPDLCLLCHDGGRGRSSRWTGHHHCSFPRPRHPGRRPYRPDETMNGYFHLWLIPLLPFAGFLINGLFGRRLPKALVTTVALLAPLGSLLVVLANAPGFFGDTPKLTAPLV